MDDIDSVIASLAALALEPGDFELDFGPIVKRSNRFAWHTRENALLQVRSVFLRFYEELVAEQMSNECAEYVNEFFLSNIIHVETFPKISPGIYCKEVFLKAGVWSNVRNASRKYFDVAQIPATAFSGREQLRSIAVWDEMDDELYSALLGGTELSWTTRATLNNLARRGG